MQIEFLRRRTHGWWFVVSVFCVSSPALAQQIPTKKVDPPERMSIAGRVIAVRTVDPTSSDAEEIRIRSRLSRPWGRQFRCSDLQQLVAQLNTIVPASLNERSLDEIGLSADVKIKINVAMNETPIATLARALKSLDLTWSLRAGRCTIETIETAEQSLVVRVYDVTPLVVVDLGRQSDHMPVRQRADFQSLNDLIQTTIRPETWEAMGGPSSFGWFTIGKRCLMTIATTTETHLEIELLMNHLNRLGHPNQLQQQRKGVKKSPGLPKFGRSTVSLPR